MSGPEEIAQDNEDLLEQNNKLKRENESLKAQSNKDYDRISQAQEAAHKAEEDLDDVKKQRNILLNDLHSEKAANAKLYVAKEEAERKQKEEQERHEKTINELRERNKEKDDWVKMGNASWEEAEAAKAEVSALRMDLVEKEALLAGAEEAYANLEEALLQAQQEVQKDEEARIWLDVINKDLERSFALLGLDLTAENIVRRMRELEQQQSSHTNRHSSGTSMDFGQTLPKKRPSSIRKTSLGDELDRVAADDDDEGSEGDFVEEPVMVEEPVITEDIWAAKHDDADVPYEANNKAQSHVEDHGIYTPIRDPEALFHEEPPMRSKSTSTLTEGDEDSRLATLLAAARKEAAEAKKASELKDEMIQDLGQKLNTRPANGAVKGTAVTQAVQEKKLWEALLDAPWWTKLFLLLLSLLWLTSTLGAIAERQRWVWANDISSEMVRFHAAPPTLGGILGSALGRAQRYGTYG